MVERENWRSTSHAVFSEWHPDAATVHAEELLRVPLFEEAFAGVAPSKLTSLDAVAVAAVASAALS